MTRLSERLTFDAVRGEIRDQSRRYLMLRPDVLMGMFRALDPAARQGALDAFAASIARHGRDSVLAYLDHLHGDRAALLDAVQDTASDLGWGCWRFARAKSALRLTVDNSPFADGFGVSEHPVCAPIRAMLQTVAQIVLQSEVDSAEHACASMGSAVCEFEAAARPHGDRS
jgi:predicted hydrocarbon binding protein